MLVKALPWLTLIWTATEAISLKTGFLNPFFYDAMHAHVQGVDYYSLPKAFINLASGISAYDTFKKPHYGPYLTWYLAHPILAVELGSWLSMFSPGMSYVIYTCFSFALMAGSASLLAGESDDRLVRRLIWFLMLGAFPTYWMLYVGNVQAILVLALCLLFKGMISLRYRHAGSGFIFAGLLLSLLSKPVVLFMLPVLVLLEETRASAALACLVYGAVSLICEVVPLLNPQAIGLEKVVWLAAHPTFVHDHMNIYRNGFAVNAWMLDNSIHWFNLIAQSGVRLMHIDVFSLAVFIDTIIGRYAPDWIFKLPIALVLVGTVFVSRLRERDVRLDAALLLLMGTSLVFFLGYPTVWEYQYTSVLPVAAVALLLRSRQVVYRRFIDAMIVLGACAWFPSLYILTEGRPHTAAVLAVIAADRVLPVTALFVVVTAAMASIAVARLRRRIV